MDELVEDEELLKKIIKEFLKLGSELKRVKRKGNSQLKQEISKLSNGIVVLKDKETDIQRSWDVIRMQECRIDVKTFENNKSFFLKNDYSQDGYRCQHPGCKSVFKHKTNFTAHQNIHSAKYQCHVCQKCLKSPNNLQDHLRVHTGERPFVCDWVGCGKRFNHKKHLNEHIIHKHTDDCLFQCNKSDCGKWFKTKNCLTQHLKRFHSSHRPFQCQMKGCDYRFKRKFDLENHMNHVHSNINKFRCQFENCQKTFKSKGELNRHQKVHL